MGVVLGTDLYSSEAAYTQTEEVPYVVMDFGGRHADVMFVEVTACPWDDDFVDAACMAYETVSDSLDFITDNDLAVFVRKMRLDGIDPILGI